MKKKCLIWGTGREFMNNFHLIQYYEMMDAIEVVGVTSNESYYKSILSYRFIPKDDIKTQNWDVLIIAASGERLRNIENEAVGMGIDEKIIVPIKVMALPTFDFDKYSAIKANVPTVFSPHCWGGMTYNSLGLPFKSPFINMFEKHDDFLKFLKNPREYVEYPLKFVEMQYESILKREYPVVSCGDILLFFNHYETFEDAKECWDRRKKRIDWENIFVEFYDEDRSRVEEFLDLPYEKKVCFVPFAMEHKSVISIDYKNERSNKPFWGLVTDTVGCGAYYDVFELLLNNNIVPIAEIK